MTRSRGHLWAGLACAALFVACAIYASHSYWGALDPQHPEGEYITFGHRWPDPWGWVAWHAVKPLLLASLLGGVWCGFRYAKLRRQEQSDLACPKCGYDLTGNVSGICPECGAAVIRADA